MPYCYESDLERSCLCYPHSKPWGFNLQIVHLEMLNIVIALRTWSRVWCHSTISVYCDNLGVVFVVKTGKTKDPFLALCVINIWLLTAFHGIDLQIDHVPGCHNFFSF